MRRKSLQAETEKKLENIVYEYSEIIHVLDIILRNIVFIL